LPETAQKIEFYKAISELPKVVAHDEAFIESRANLATCHIQTGDLAAAKVRRRQEDRRASCSKSLLLWPIIIETVYLTNRKFCKK
jgi:hypothetical protein